MIRDTVLILYGLDHVSHSNMYKLLLYHLINKKLLVITILTTASSWCVLLLI